MKGNEQTSTVTRLTIDMLAEENGDLREANRQLVELVADLSFERAVLLDMLDRLFRGSSDERAPWRVAA